MKARKILVSLATAATLAACSNPTVLNLEDLGAQPTLEELNADNDTSVDLAGTSGGLGKLVIRKIYDSNQNGKYDSGEAGIPNWGVRITSLYADGTPSQVSDIQVTPQGNARWRGVVLNVVYGKYTIEELAPVGTNQSGTIWNVTGPASRTVSVNANSSVRGVEFAGACLENGAVVAFPKLSDFYGWKCRANFDLLPRIGSFTAGPNQIQTGGSSTLTWNVLDYSNLEIDQGVGAVTVFTGSKGVTPASTMAYTLKATNGFGSRTANVTINVNSVPSGSPDNGFGTDGRVLTDVLFPNQKSFLHIGAVATQMDGKILIAGAGVDFFKYDVGTWTQFVLRFKTDGTPDTNFGVDGKVLISNSNLKDGFSTIRVSPDGAIDVIGIDAQQHLTIMRILANGKPDTNFGINGTVTQSQNMIATLAVQPDGKIVAATRAPARGLIRFHQQGSIDLNFGINGFVAFNPVASRSDLESIFLLYEIVGCSFQSDGKILVSTSVPVVLDDQIAANAYKRDISLVRYASNGSLDTSFGKQGNAQIDLGSDDDSIDGLLLRKNGELLKLGQESTVATGLQVPENIFLGPVPRNGFSQYPNGFYLGSGNGASIFAARFDIEGRKDTLFAQNGLLTASGRIGEQGSTVKDVLTQPDGKLLLIGVANITDQVVLYRFHP
jgi:uncharacterized delta-60 repeat protein